MRGLACFRDWKLLMKSILWALVNLACGTNIFRYCFILTLQVILFEEIRFIFMICIQVVIGWFLSTLLGTLLELDKVTPKCVASWDVICIFGANSYAMCTMCLCWFGFLPIFAGPSISIYCWNSTWLKLGMCPGLMSSDFYCHCFLCSHVNWNH